MIPVRPVPEPPAFDSQARKPGLAWLKQNPKASRPRDYWSRFKPQLADGFNNLCGYVAMFEPVGTVDHFLSFEHHRGGAYEWDNYRYAQAWLNSSKQSADADVLDPYEVQEGWFEILLPSLQLVRTDRVPPALRARADYTLERLHLRDDERVIRQRRAWYEMYEQGELSLEGLRSKAPLIAAAVEKQLAQAAGKAGAAAAPSPTAQPRANRGRAGRPKGRKAT